MFVAHIKPKAGKNIYLNIGHYLVHLGFEVRAQRDGWDVYNKEASGDAN